MVVWERGRGLCETFWIVEISNGDLGEEWSGEATCDEVVDEVEDIV